MAGDSVAECSLEDLEEKRIDNLRYLESHWKKLTAGRYGKFLVVAGCGKKKTVKSFSSRSQAGDFCDSLDEKDACSAVVWYIDNPLQVYVI